MANAPRMFSGLQGFFGGGGQDQQQNQNSNQDDLPMDDGVQEENQESGIGDIIGQMWEPPEEEEDDSNNNNNNQNQNQTQLGPDGKPLPTKQQQLAAKIQQAIAGMKVTDDMIPRDFDPTNPQHLRDLLGKTQQATALQTIQLAFEPMQMAIEESIAKLTQTIDAKLSGFGNQQSESAILKEIVPEIEDSQYSGLVKTLFDQAKKSKAGAGNPKVAAQMVRKGLDAMGIKSQKPADPMSGGFKQGSAALDAYAPLPKPQQNQQRRQGS